MILLKIIHILSKTEDKGWVMVTKNLMNFSSVPLSIIQSPEHIKLAIQAAMETIVLMKNDDGNGLPYLPIKSEVKRACVR